MSADFLAAVQRSEADFAHGIAIGPAITCPTCEEIHDVPTRDERGRFLSRHARQEMMCDEGSFSWSECDTCGSTLGGNRYDAHGLPLRAEPIHLDICVDCLMYFANGDVPESWEG